MITDHGCAAGCWELAKKHHRRGPERRNQIQPEFSRVDLWRTARKSAISPIASSAPRLARRASVVVARRHGGAKEISTCQLGLQSSNVWRGLSHRSGPSAPPPCANGPIRARKHAVESRDRQKRRGLGRWPSRNGLSVMVAIPATTIGPTRRNDLPSGASPPRRRCGSGHRATCRYRKPDRRPDTAAIGLQDYVQEGSRLTVAGQE